MPAGQPRRFKTPVALEKEFAKYVKWVHDNPWVKQESIKSGDNAGMIFEVPIQRPLTLSGFAVFCKVCLQTILNYGDAEMYPEYFDIYSYIDNYCYTQKFDGAAVGAFNASIIARDLGLKDASTVDNTHQFKQIPTIKKNGKEVEFKVGVAAK